MINNGSLVSGAIQASTGTSSQTSMYAYAGNQALGSEDAKGNLSINGTLTGFSNSLLGTQNYVVQVGDTLASIAQAVYGTSQYGYLIAEANGLQGDGDLTPGQTIALPQVTTSNNTATTFKPYDPSQVIGSTKPALPPIPPPPPSHHGCNAVAEIVVIAVAVVATVVTAGAAAVALGAVASGTSVFAAGATVLAGEAGLTAAAAGAAFAGGVAGSVAGQLTGDALGVNQGFSLKEALTNGLTTAATAGIGSALRESGSAYSLLADSNGSLEPVGAALEGAGAYAANVAADQVTGQPEQFSWANLVSSAVGSGLTSEFGLPTSSQLAQGAGTGSFLKDVGGGLVNGAINSGTARLLGGNAANSGQVTRDAFGNALANSAIAGIKAYEANQTQPTAPDFRAEDMQEMRDEIQAEAQGRSDQSMSALAQTTSDSAPIELNKSDVTVLPDIALSSGEQGRLATTTLWPYAYVDPYAIARNDGIASGVESTQTFRLPDEAPATATDLSQAGAPVTQGSALDQMLVAISNSAQGYRDLSRQNLDNSSSPGWAALNAGIYAINSVSSAVVGGFAQTARILTNSDVRQQFAQGIETLATTDPRTTATAAWNHWDSLSTEDRLIQSASVLVTLGGSAVSKAGDVEVLAEDVRNLDEVAGTSNAATSIGKSGYASVQDFSDAAFVKYQGLVDEGYANAQQALQDGTLQVPLAGC